jgi:hypothetical protein
MEPTADMPQGSTVGSWTGSPTEYDYQWSTCSRTVCRPVPGAIGASYTPQAGDYGKTLKVTVVACSHYGCSPAVSSAHTAMVDVGRAATAAIQVPETTNQAYYYVGSGGQIYTKFFDGTSWSTGPLGSGQAAAAGTKPVVVRNALTQAQSVYYVGANGHIWAWFFDGSHPWVNSEVPGQPAAAGTSVTAIRVTNTGDQDLYYVGSDNQIWTSYLPYGGSWGTGRLGVSGGQPVAANTSPVVVRDPVSGRQQVFYVGPEQAIWSWFFDGSKWANARLGGEKTGQPAAVGASPTAIIVPSNGNQAVYYVGSDKQVWTWFFDGASAWTNGKLAGAGTGVEADPTVTPFVVRSFSGNGAQNVYYVSNNSEKRVYSWFFDGAAGSSWKNGYLDPNPGEKAAAGSPLTVVQDPTNENQSLFYKGANGGVFTWGFNGTAWFNKEL